MALKTFPWTDLAEAVSAVREAELPTGKGLTLREAVFWTWIQERYITRDYGSNDSPTLKAQQYVMFDEEEIHPWRG